MPVYCKAIDGPFDDGMWTTMSPHVKIWVSQDTVQDRSSLTYWAYDVRLVYFKHAILYYYTETDKITGFYLYSVKSPAYSHHAYKSS